MTRSIFFRAGGVKMGDEGASRNENARKTWFRAFPIGVQKRLLHLGLFEDRLVCLCGLKDAIACPSADVVFLQVFADEFDADGAPAVVGILRGVVADGVKVGEVVADGGEGLLLILPALGEIGFATCGFAHALEDGGG